MKRALVLVAALAITGCTTNNTTIVNDDLGGQAGPDGSGLACTPNAKECVNDTLARVCPADGSGWLAVQCQNGDTCLKGDCALDPTTATCSPGDGACIGNTTALRCNANGVGFAMATCPANTQCFGTGQCFGTCVVGESRCDNSGSLSTCTDGVSFTAAGCPTGQQCVTVQTTPSGIALCVPATDCQPDPNGCDTVCGNKLNSAADQTKFTSTCVATASGFHWQAASCLAPATCFPTAGVCGTFGDLIQASCAQQCIVGDVRCGVDGVSTETCGADGTFGPDVACTPGLLCFTPTGATSAVCGDAVCSVGAKGACAIDPADGKTKLRACGANGRVSDAFTVCAALCVPLPPGNPLNGLVPGSCGVECQPGDQRCVPFPGGPPNTAFQTCQSGVWSATTTACNAATTDQCFDFVVGISPRAVCGACAPGSTQCGSGTTGLQTCGTNGQFGAAVACAVGSCVASGIACVADCVPGRKVCVGAKAAGGAGAAPVSFGTVASVTCTAAGTIPTTPTCPNGAGCCAAVAGVPTSCRSDQAGNALGCVPCAGGLNEFGVADTRCNTGGMIETCKADSSAWQNPIACTMPYTCQLPQAPAVTGAYCHFCQGAGGGSGPPACSDSFLSGFGLSCAAFGEGAPIDCLDSTGTDVADCCSNDCFADTGAPAFCGQ